MEKNPLVPDYILKKLILFYGFTKEIQEKTKAQLNPLIDITYDNFYIINGDWINKYKEFYSYDQIINIIKHNNIDFPKYFSYKSNIETILSTIKKYQIYQKEKEFPIELKSGISFAPMIKDSFTNNLKIHDNFYIVNSELNEMISRDKENPEKPNYFLVNTINSNAFLSKYSYFIFVNNIEICTMNKDGIFVHQYCIKLGKETDLTSEITQIIKSGGIEAIVKKKGLEKKDSDRYGNHGGLIFNIGQIRKDKEKEQQKKDDIYHSVKYEKKGDNNPKDNTKLYQRQKRNNMNPYSHVITNKSKLEPNPENTSKLSETQLFLEKAKSKNKNQNPTMQGTNTFPNDNIIINQNQINNNTNNNINKAQNINQFIQPNNGSYPQQLNYNQGPFQFQNNMNVNINANMNNNMNMNANNCQAINSLGNQNNYNNFNIMNNFQQNMPYNPNMPNNMNNSIQNNMNNNMNFYNQQQQNQFCNNNITPQPIQNMNTNNNYNNNYENNPQDNNNKNSSITSLKELKFVPKIGLINLGQTCYMNSVLQCFSNLYPITNYFLNPKKQELIKQFMDSTGQKESAKLYSAYKDLIEQLWRGKPNKPFSPTNFKKRLQKLNPLFSDNTPGDSKDFTNYLIMQLHNELNGIESNPEAQKVQNMENVNVDHFNQQQVFNYFSSDFIINHYSIISRFFYGITQSQYECQGCKMKLIQQGINQSPIKYNYENFFYLEFPLEEVRKYKAELNNALAYYQNITEVDIFDCFNYNQRVTSINGYCENCKIDTAQIMTRTDIYSPPVILILIFNRGKGIQYKIKINFPQMLNTSQIVLNNINCYYELQGVVKHLGESSSYGHFIAYCRSAVPSFHNQWYCYNDDTVVEVNNWNDIVNNGDTYILFYELKNNN